MAENDFDGWSMSLYGSLGHTFAMLSVKAEPSSAVFVMEAW